MFVIWLNIEDFKFQPFKDFKITLRLAKTHIVVFLGLFI
jgi:hypothetical protein